MRFTTATLVAILVMAGPATATDGNCARTVAVADLHGGYEAFVEILRATDLVDENLDWAGGDACLVQLGDVVDRGDRSREILDLLRSLHEQAPERVHALLGNHEVMNLLGDLRYVTTGEFASYADLETAEMRARGRTAFRATLADPDLDDDAVDIAFAANYPAGWFGHRAAFGADGVYGSWLLDRRALLIIDGTLFVHGGVSLTDAERGLDALNRDLVDQVRQYDELHAVLAAAGALSPLTPYGASFERVATWPHRLQVEATTPGAATVPTDPELLKAAQSFLALTSAVFARPDGPIWNRELVLADERTFAPTVDAILETLGVERIVVGHTTAPKEIRSRFDGRVFAIDTGAGPAYGGLVSALELSAEGIFAVFPGERRLLKAPGMTDREVESLLTTGAIAEIARDAADDNAAAPIYVAVRAPGASTKAVFMTGGARRRAGADPGHPDYERAAYLIDRHLDLGLVPVAVLREIDGQRGALSQYMTGATDERERRERGLEPPDPAAWQRQLATMRAFDALVLDGVRDPRTARVTTRAGTWHLHLTRNARSFGTGRTLPEAFSKAPPRLPRSLYDRLRTLSEAELRELLHGLVSRRRVDALIARRDALIALIDGERERLGDDVVFQEARARTSAETAP